jgi:hypothetical protein
VASHLLQLVTQRTLPPQLLAARALNLRLQRLCPLAQPLRLALQLSKCLFVLSNLGAQGLEARGILAAHFRGRLQLAQALLQVGGTGGGGLCLHASLQRQKGGQAGLAQLWAGALSSQHSPKH